MGRRLGGRDEPTGQADISYHYDSQPKLEVGDFFFEVIKFRHAAPERC